MGLRRSPGGTHRGLHQTSQPRTRPELRSPRRHSTTKALNPTSRKKHGGFLAGSFGVWGQGNALAGQRGGGKGNGRGGRRRGNGRGDGDPPKPKEKSEEVLCLDKIKYWKKKVSDVKDTLKQQVPKLKGKPRALGIHKATEKILPKMKACTEKLEEFLGDLDINAAKAEIIKAADLVSQAQDLSKEMRPHL